MVVLPFANASLEAPAFQLDDTVDTGFADMLIRPIDLGWHTPRADVAAGFQLYLPTGRYEQGGDDNLGKGMWTYEPFLGTTVFFDEKKTFSLATTAYWEIHGNEGGHRRKGRTDPHAPGRPGQVVPRRRADHRRRVLRPVEAHQGSAARVRCCPAETRSTLDFPNKHKVFGFGPDVTLPIATKSKLFALVNVRYLWETGARVKTQGQTPGRHRDLPHSQRQAEVNLAKKETNHEDHWLAIRGLRARRQH